MSSGKVKVIKSGVFIDASNLLWAMKQKDEKTGKKIHYNICFKKLKQYLKRHYSPSFYHYYACEDSRPKKEPYITHAKNTQKFFQVLDGLGYNVIKKELKHIGDGTKCDTDVEITMAMHKYANDIENIILFSGDSDFLSAVEHFHSLGKHVRIFSFEKFLSWELKDFAIKNPRCNYKLLDDLRGKLERTDDES